MTKTVDAAVFQQMVIHAAAAINAQKQGINDLNVFPVPDGDTGTNMSLTIAAAAQEMKKKRFDSVGSAAGACASALLRGARGNSGVIRSLGAAELPGGLSAGRVLAVAAPAATASRSSRPRFRLVK